MPFKLKVKRGTFEFNERTGTYDAQDIVEDYTEFSLALETFLSYTGEGLKVSLIYKPEKNTDKEKS